MRNTSHPSPHWPTCTVATSELHYQTHVKHVALFDMLHANLETCALIYLMCSHSQLPSHLPVSLRLESRSTQATSAQPCVKTCPMPAPRARVWCAGGDIRKLALHQQKTSTPPFPAPTSTRLYTVETEALHLLTSARCNTLRMDVVVGAVPGRKLDRHHSMANTMSNTLQNKRAMI